MDARIHIYQEENGNVETANICFFIPPGTSYAEFRNEFSMSKFVSIDRIWETWVTPSGQVFFYVI